MSSGYGTGSITEVQSNWSKAVIQLMVLGSGSENFTTVVRARSNGRVRIAQKRRYLKKLPMRRTWPGTLLLIRILTNSAMEDIH